MQCDICGFENPQDEPCQNCDYSPARAKEAVIQKDEPNPWYLNLFGIVLALGTPCAIIIIVLLIAKGYPWVAENVFPITSAISGGGFLLIVPIGLTMALFRRFRGRAGIGLILYSYLAFFDLWARALVIAYAMTGWIGMIIGLFFAGIGIVPVAMGGAAFRAQWSVLIYLLVATVIVYAFRMFGMFLISKSE